MREDLLEKSACHDCNAQPDALHDPGCDTERCPRCGGQIISCECFTEATWPSDAERMPWTGIWPGVVEAIEFDLWCKWEPNKQFEADKERLGLEKALKKLVGAPGRWLVCGKDDPDAKPDLNRLHQVAIWDREKRRFVKSPKDWDPRVCR